MKRSIPVMVSEAVQDAVWRAHWSGTFHAADRLLRHLVFGHGRRIGIPVGRSLAVRPIDVPSRE